MSYEDGRFGLSSLCRGPFRPMSKPLVNWIIYRREGTHSVGVVLGSRSKSGCMGTCGHENNSLDH